MRVRNVGETYAALLALYACERTCTPQWLSTGGRSAVPSASWATAGWWRRVVALLWHLPRQAPRTGLYSGSRCSGMLSLILANSSFVNRRSKMGCKPPTPSSSSSSVRSISASASTGSDAALPEPRVVSAPGALFAAAQNGRSRAGPAQRTVVRARRRACLLACTAAILSTRCQSQLTDARPTSVEHKTAMERPPADTGVKRRNAGSQSAWQLVCTAGVPWRGVFCSATLSACQRSQRQRRCHTCASGTPWPHTLPAPAQQTSAQWHIPLLHLPALPQACDKPSPAPGSVSSVGASCRQWVQHPTLPTGCVGDAEQWRQTVKLTRTHVRPRIRVQRCTWQPNMARKPLSGFVGCAARPAAVLVQASTPPLV